MKITLRPSLQLHCPSCHDSVKVAEDGACRVCAGEHVAVVDLAEGHSKSAPIRRRPILRGLDRRLRRRGEVLARAKRLGLGALALVSATIVLAGLIPLSMTLSSSGDLAELATLLCLACAGSSVITTGMWLSALASAYSGSASRRK